MLDRIPQCSHKWIHSLISLQIPKTASSSLSLCLGERNLLYKHRGLFQEKFGKHPLYRGVFDVRHCIPEHVFFVLGKQVYDYFSFAVVRKTVDRIASAYRFGKGKKLWGVYGLAENTSADQFVDWLYQGFKNKRKDVLILLPQTTWTHSPIFRPNVVLKFENLAEEWQKMISDYQISNLPPLPHENKSSGTVEFSQESIQKLFDIYSEDTKLESC